ncbi:MAG: SGNH/GDSL hydrolase family protein [Dehalococcoidia bacterium]
MRARLLVAAVALVVLTLVGGVREDAGADPAITGYPDSIAGLGDSITRAVNSDAYGDRPESSWVTGTNASVNPYYARLLAAHPAIAGNRYNEAVSGAQMTDLNGQAQDAVADGAELVFIFMGSNDVCTPSEAAMTPVATFQSQFESAMTTLSSGLPDARIAVLSIPNIYNLWSILKDNSNARAFWDAFDICQSMLVNPLSTATLDVQRRANVSQRNQEFNDVLFDVCGQYAHCKFDGYLGYTTAFTPAHVSTLDYFHPSIAGQALIAQLAWDVAYDWSDTTPPVSGSAGSASGGLAAVSFSASDAAGALGVEYHTGGAWQTFDTPVNMAAGTMFTWRAVDDNGNVEATQSCRVGPWIWPSGDADCDGFTSAAEGVFGTDASDACGYVAGGAATSDTWPPDLVESDSVNIQDVLVLKPAFGGTAGARYDIVASGGTINISDVLALKPFFGTACVP